jgi:hypothetical protein
VSSTGPSGETGDVRTCDASATAGAIHPTNDSRVPRDWKGAAAVLGEEFNVSNFLVCIVKADQPCFKADYPVSVPAQDEERAAKPAVHETNAQFFKNQTVTKRCLLCDEEVFALFCSFLI